MYEGKETTMRRVITTAIALLFLAAVASANGGHGQGMGGGMGGPGGGMGNGPQMGGGQAIVGTDGTVYLTRMNIDTGTNTATTQIVAVRSNGSTAWTVTLQSAHGPLLLAGSNLILVDRDEPRDATASSTITALSTATGATAWTRTISGHVQSIEPFSGGLYAVVVTPATTTSGTATRSLVAIGNDGSVLWTVNV
jgi:hypothetical protein